MAQSGYKSVSRIDQDKKALHGWYVRVTFKGQTHPKFFSDAQYGSRPDALTEAVAWRDATEYALGKPRTERVVVALSRRNQTGVIGVRRSRKAMTRDGQKMGPVYEVYWRPTPQTLQRTTVSITKYGEQEAFRRAYVLRKAKERELYGSELPTPGKRRRPTASKEKR
jgi:hypothetical protein